MTTTYVDTYGATVTQLTDETMGTQNVHAYSLWNVLNADDSKAYLLHDWVPWIHPHDAAPFALTSIPRCPRLSSVSAQWDPRDPRLLYVLENSKAAPYQQRLLEFDVEARTWRVLRDFAFELPGYNIADGLNLSASGLVFSFHATAPGAGGVWAVTWDRRRDGVRVFLGSVGMLPTPIHSTAISRCGTWLQVSASNPTPDIAFCNLLSGEIVYARDADAALGWVEHLYMGRMGVVGGRKGDNALVYRRYDDWGAGVELMQFRLDDGRPDWTPYHTALVGPGEQSVLVSTYGGTEPGKLIEVAIDGSWSRTLALTGSSGSTYWSQPRASVSRDGRKVIWTSDHGGGPRCDVFVMDLPPPPAEVALREERDHTLHVLAQEQADHVQTMGELEVAQHQVATLQAEVTAREAERDQLAVVVSRVRADVAGVTEVES